MGLFRSILRFFGALFGLAQGGTEIATDNLVTATPETIRAQFRKTKEDLTNNYHTMRNALTELIKIREQKQAEAIQLDKDEKALETQMLGAIEQFKQTKDEKYRAKYGELASKKEELDARQAILEEQLENQNKAIEQYKSKLVDLHKRIENLSKEEAETIADIVSSEKIRELNDQLAGLSNDDQTKNLQAIRERRASANVSAKLSGELSGLDRSDEDKLLTQAGNKARFMSDFDLAVGVTDKLSEDQKKELEEASHG